MTLPGIDQACFQTAVTDNTPMTCAKGREPLCEYACISRPSAASSGNVLGKTTEMGKE